MKMTIFYLSCAYTEGYGLDLWCLMPLPPIFQLYRDSQFYWLIKLEKTTDLPQVTDSLTNHITYIEPIDI